MRERADANRTREAGHLDEIQGVVPNILDLFRKGAVGFIGWLDADVVIIRAARLACHFGEKKPAIWQT